MPVGASGDSVGVEVAPVFPSTVKMTMSTQGLEVPSWVGGDGKNVAPELDKSQESAASPSCQYSPSGVLLAQQFSQVDQELHTRCGKLVQCVHVLCHDALK